MEEILQDLATTAPRPTRHGQKEAHTAPPLALATADLVYMRKGGQLQPLEQPYSGPYKAVFWIWIRVDPDSNCQAGSESGSGIRILKVKLSYKNPFFHTFFMIFTYFTKQKFSV